MTQSGNADPPVGLETRNVFLDTEVFRSYGHNVDAEPLKVLGRYVEDGIFVLHTTDVTLGEVRRQLVAMETELRISANSAANKLERWNSRFRRKQDRLPVPDLLTEPVEPAPAYREFERILRREWGVREHRAADLPVAPVLDRYFAGQAPFDRPDSKKEFPDALALLALENWCFGTQQRIYVVSKDNAVLRAAEESEHFIGVEDLDHLLSLVTMAQGHDVAEVVSTAIEEPAVQTELQESLSENIGSVGWLYGGDRDDGEVVNVEILKLRDVHDITILRVDQDRVACVARVRLLVSAGINYMDYSVAIWDNEDQRYYGGESVDIEIEESVAAKIFLELAVDGEAVTLSSAGFLSRDLLVTDSFSDDYRNY